VVLGCFRLWCKVHLVSAFDVHELYLVELQEVSATLLHIGVPHLVEYLTPDGLFSIDIALRNGNQVCPHVGRSMPSATRASLGAQRATACRGA
jgi:hypothetical protein